MTKAIAIRHAQDRGLAVYRNDTLRSIVDRIHADIRAEQERCQPVRRAVAKLAVLRDAHPVQRRPQRQLWLPIRLPHSLIVACGMVA